MKNGLIIDDKGTKRYYLNGQLHRDNGLPAIITPLGACFYFQHGEPHNENGMAAVFVNGDGYWFLHGVEFETHTAYQVALNNLT